MELAIGSLVIIDGKAWTVASVGGSEGNTLRAVAEDNRQAIYCDKREVIYMGAGLFGLAGRIEPPAVNPQANVVASVAVADAGASSAG